MVLDKNKGTSDTEFHWEHIKTNFLLKCSLEPKLTQQVNNMNCLISNTEFWKSHVQHFYLAKD